MHDAPSSDPCNPASRERGGKLLSTIGRFVGLAFPSTQFLLLMPLTGTCGHRPPLVAPSTSRISDWVYLCCGSIVRITFPHATSSNGQAHAHPMPPTPNQSLFNHPAQRQIFVPDTVHPAPRCRLNIPCVRLQCGSLPTGPNSIPQSRCASCRLVHVPKLTRFTTGVFVEWW